MVVAGIPIAGHADLGTIQPTCATCHRKRTHVIIPADYIMEAIHGLNVVKIP
jgi:hypothetical protein